MISFFTLAISQKISLHKIYRLVYPYPTFSSGILKVADFFMRETLPNIGKELGAFLKYRFEKITTKGHKAYTKVFQDNLTRLLHRAGYALLRNDVNKGEKL
jgi:hypothetical protein